jgi:hypothetical protein
LTTRSWSHTERSLRNALWTRKSGYGAGQKSRPLIWSDTEYGIQLSHGVASYIRDTKEPQFAEAKKAIDTARKSITRMIADELNNWLSAIFKADVDKQIEFVGRIIQINEQPIQVVARHYKDGSVDITLVDPKIEFYEWAKRVKLDGGVEYIKKPNTASFTIGKFRVSLDYRFGRAGSQMNVAIHYRKKNG